MSKARNPLSSYVVAGIAVAAASAVVVPVIATARRDAHGQTCAANLQRIGQAMQQYLADYDQTFPPAYCATYEDAGNHYAAWDSLLDPYIGSGIAPESGWAYVDGWDAVVVPETENKVAPGAVRSPWHCPEDIPGGALSYGLNPMVSGAYKVFHNKGVDEKVVRAQEWQDSLRLSRIPDPASIVWAGDTNRLWDDKKKRYTAQVFPEWPRRTDLYLRQMTGPELRRWYRRFLSRDLTDYRDDCPYPLAWGCRAPAYRHTGSGSGGKKLATMLFCDGHVRSFPAGTLQIGNVFPDHGSAAAAPPPPPPAPAPEYTLTAIQSKDVTSGMHAGGLNNHGDVAGGNYWDMILWKDEVGHDLHWNPPSVGSGISWGINDSDVIVSDDKLYVNGQFRPLGLMPGYLGIAARAINNRGQVVGRAILGDSSAGSHAFLWQDGRFQDLGVPPGCVSSTAYAINDRGEVVGSAVTKDNRTHAFLWSKGVMRDLGTLPGGTLSAAYGINNKGQVVGDSDSADGKGFVFHPVLWENGRVRDLGMPAGPTEYRYCMAKAINDRGQVVCQTTDLDHVPLSPMLWDARHGMRRLDTLCPFDSGWLLRETYGINARGQILCWGFYHTAMSLALLTPK